MNRIFIIFSIIIIIFSFLNQGLCQDKKGNNKLTYKEAKKMVKNLTYSKQKTIEEYFKEKVSVPAVEDMGWSSYPLNNGGFNIVKYIEINNNLHTKYKWRVSPNGDIKPLNGHAKTITNQE